MMKAAHVVTTPSNLLADQFAQQADDVRVIENHLAPPMIVATLPPRVKGNFRVGWIAANEHRTDAEELRLKERFERLMTTYPQVDVISLGLALGIDNPRYVQIPNIDLLELPRFAAHFDVAIAPLVDTPFNRSRSNIKLKEYAAGGAPWLASNVGPYVGMTEWQGGQVISNDDWEDAIIALLYDPGRRRRMSRLGHRWARTQDVMLHLGEWEAAFAAAANQARL